MASTLNTLIAGEKAAPIARPLRLLDLGVIPYGECWEAQKRLAAQVADGLAPDTLLLLEHPHTYTCGRRGGRDHVLITEAELARRGIAVLDVDRGGDVTYHGPGQLVAYPIIRLAEAGRPVDYHAYLRNLEQALIDTLAQYGIEAFRAPGYSGVWVGQGGGHEKIAAIGVKVDGRGVSTHGVALNITTDLDYFGHIVPCGISDKGVTSMSVLLAEPPSMEDAKAVFAAQFARTFGFDAGECMQVQL